MTLQDKAKLALPFMRARIAGVTVDLLAWFEPIPDVTNSMLDILKTDNPDIWPARLSFMEALADGKTVQRNRFGQWVELSAVVNLLNPHVPVEDFRVKPTEAKWRPWTRDEIPTGAWIRSSGLGSMDSRLLGKNLRRNPGSAFGFVNADVGGWSGQPPYVGDWTEETLLGCAEYSLDHGAHWYRCGVDENGIVPVPKWNKGFRVVYCRKGVIHYWLAPLDGLTTDPAKAHCYPTAKWPATPGSDIWSEPWTTEPSKGNPANPLITAPDGSASFAKNFTTKPYDEAELRATPYVGTHAERMSEGIDPAYPARLVGLRRWVSIAEVPLNAFFRKVGSPNFSRCLGVTGDQLDLGSGDGHILNVDLKQLFQESEHSVDGGKTWLPCGQSPATPGESTAPKTAIRCWGHHEVPVGAQIKYKDPAKHESRHLITGIGSLSGRVMINSPHEDLHDVFDRPTGRNWFELTEVRDLFVHSTDGGVTWKPCGVFC